MVATTFEGFPVPTIPARPARQRERRLRERRPERQSVFRRRRLAVAAVLVLAAFAAGMLLALTLVSSPAGGSLTAKARQARQVSYVVQPGDTLWKVAGALAPGEDPRVVVDSVVAERGTSRIVPGEVVVWPAD